MMKMPTIKLRKTPNPVGPIYERVMVIAQPHSYIAQAPRSELIRLFGSKGRYLPATGARLLRLMFALAIMASVWVVAFMVLSITIALVWRMTFAYAIGPSLLIMLFFGAIAYFKWWKKLVPYFHFLQPLWLLMRVTDTFEYKTVYSEVVDNESNEVYQIPVDVQITNEKLETPELVPLVPRALLEEAMPGPEQPTDRGIQRAEYLYLALNPIDIVTWFRRAGGGLGKADAIVGAGFVFAMLLAIFLFVQAQSPTDLPPPGV